MISWCYLRINHLGGEGDRVLASKTLHNTAGLDAAGGVGGELERAVPEAAIVKPYAQIRISYRATKRQMNAHETENNLLGLGRGDVGLEQGNIAADGLEHCNLLCNNM